MEWNQIETGWAGRHEEPIFGRQFAWNLRPTVDWNKQHEFSSSIPASRWNPSPANNSFNFKQSFCRQPFECFSSNVWQPLNSLSSKHWQTDVDLCQYQTFPNDFATKWFVGESKSVRNSLKTSMLVLGAGFSSVHGDLAFIPSPTDGGFSFTTNYDRLVQNLTSSWATTDRAETLIVRFRSKLEHFKDALNSVWSSMDEADTEPANFRFYNSSERTGEFPILSCGNPYVAISSFFARVVSKAQTLVTKFTKRLSRLIKLRNLFIIPADEPLVLRTVIERKFFCLHGFHPPDLELPEQLFCLLSSGFVPGMLPV